MIFVAFVTILVVSTGVEAAKCVGTIGFSSHGASETHNTGLIKFKGVTFNSGHGWVHETGAFTAVCPGVYRVSFAGYGDHNTK